MPARTPRTEGFAGQHQVVLPSPLCEHARRHPLLRGLHVTDAGYYPVANGHLVERPQGSSTTLIILCLRGSGWVRFQGEYLVVLPGNLVWLEAGQPHAYGSDENSPWTIVWTHFSGDEAASWLGFLQSCAGTQNRMLPIPQDHVDEIALDRVYHALERGQSTRHQIAAASALRAALSRAADTLVESHGPRSARERVAASVEMIRKDSARAYRLGELASGAGMSVTHFCAHFRKLTGFAPADFMIRLRVQQACRLLDASTLTVAEIAAAVGYSDPYYFTRCFRRVMGCSPRHYRTVPKG